MKLFANTASRHNQVDVCYYLGIFLFKSLLKYFVLSVSKLEEINIYRRTFNFSKYGSEINWYEFDIKNGKFVERIVQNICILTDFWLIMYYKKIACARKHIL